VPRRSVDASAKSRIQPRLARLDAARRGLLHPPLRRASAVENLANAYELADQRAWAKARGQAALALFGDSKRRRRALVTVTSPRIALMLRSAKDRGVSPATRATP
jgi:hypothetical protein